MKISVLTVCLNAEKHIERAIQSVLNQNYGNYEHIIIDGGSTDDTLKIIQKYVHIKYISEKDNGQSDAMNKAFENSNGNIIVYLNADDSFENNVFKKIIDSFKSSNDDIVVGNLIIKDERNGQTSVIFPVISFIKLLFPNVYNFPYNPVSYFYKRKVQEQVGQFPENEHYAMDYWFLLRAFYSFKVKKIDSTLGVFYLSDLNKTIVNSNIDLKSIAKHFIITKRNKYFAFLYEFTYSIINIFNSLRTGQFYKKPFKYLIFYIGYRKKYKSFTEFNNIGFKKIYNGNEFK